MSGIHSRHAPVARNASAAMTIRVVAALAGAAAGGGECFGLPEHAVGEFDGRLHAAIFP